MLGGPGGGGGGPRLGGGGGMNELLGVGVEPNGVGAPNGAGLFKPPDGSVGVGFGLTGVDLVAASIAFIFASLSLPASIMPDRIPVRNVEIGINNSKNFWSIGDIALSGCVTKIIEYKTTNTMPVSVSVKQTPMKNFRRAIN